MDDDGHAEGIYTLSYALNRMRCNTYTTFTITTKECTHYTTSGSRTSILGLNTRFVLSSARVSILCLLRGSKQPKKPKHQIHTFIRRIFYSMRLLRGLHPTSQPASQPASQTLDSYFHPPGCPFYAFYEDGSKQPDSYFHPPECPFYAFYEDISKQPKHSIRTSICRIIHFMRLLSGIHSASQPNTQFVLPSTGLSLFYAFYEDANQPAKHQICTSVRWIVHFVAATKK